MPISLRLFMPISSVGVLDLLHGGGGVDVMTKLRCEHTHTRETEHNKCRLMGRLMVRALILSIENYHFYYFPSQLTVYT